MKSASINTGTILEGFVVELEEQGERVDRLIARRLPSLSRNRIQSLIDAGQITADGAKIVSASQKVKAGQALSVAVPPPIDDTPQPESMPLTIVYEDAHLIVIDKPAGLVVHPAPGSSEHTLVNALLAHCGDSLVGIGGVKRPGIVHRLDKDTTGLMVVAKTDIAHAGLSEAFAARDIERAYHAIAWGMPHPSSGEIDLPIARSPHNRKKMAVVANGRNAVTGYKVLRRYGSTAALVECRLQTGRTHQIRVHMTELGHPLIGDPVYGRLRKGRLKGVSSETAELLEKFSRQALHAWLLGFEHPATGEHLRFTSNAPADFAELQCTLELL